MGNEKLEKLKKENGWTGLNLEKKEILASHMGTVYSRIDMNNEKFDSIKDKLWTQAEKNRTKKHEYIVVDDSDKATHWICKDDDLSYEHCKHKPGELYRIYWDEFDREYVTIDDEGSPSCAYLAFKGEWVALEGSKQYYELVEVPKMTEEGQEDYYYKKSMKGFKHLRESIKKSMLEQKKLGYPNFKNQIAKDLIKNYNFSQDDAIRLAFSNEINEHIMDDIVWAQRMSTEYWADVINDKYKQSK